MLDFIVDSIVDYMAPNSTLPGIHDLDRKRFGPIKTQFNSSQFFVYSY